MFVSVSLHLHHCICGRICGPHRTRQACNDWINPHDVWVMPEHLHWAGRATVINETLPRPLAFFSFMSFLLSAISPVPAGATLIANWVKWVVSTAEPERYSSGRERRVNIYATIYSICLRSVHNSLHCLPHKLFSQVRKGMQRSTDQATSPTSASVELQLKFNSNYTVRKEGELGLD